MDTYDYNIIKDLIVDIVGPEISSISDCAYHGVASGCGGEFIYTRFCVHFYNEHKSVLWDMISDGADEMGVKPLDFISSLNGCGDVSDHDSLATIIVWYCVERICQEIDNDASDCAYCGEKYLSVGETHNYCSVKCYDEDNQASCDFCGNPIDYCATDGPFCSDSCKTQYEEI